MGFILNLNFNEENLPFTVSETLTCVHIPVYAYTCMKLAYADLKHEYIDAFSWHLFSKNSFIQRIKELYFP